MKYISYKIVAILAITALSGCSDASLDKLPQDQISSSTFWTNETEARLALTACYKYIDLSISLYYDTAYDDAASDNAYAQYPWEGPATDLGAGNINASLERGYKVRYTAIRQFNYFLDNVGKTPMNEDLKKRFIAEAKVLRAMTYFELARNFGAVPLLKNLYSDPIETAVIPTPEADVIAFVLSELTSVADQLPVNYAGGKNNETGRITTGAAWAIKARVELQYGKYSEAAASAKHVMGMGYNLFRVSALSAKDVESDYSNFLTFANVAEKEKFYKGMASYEQQFWANNENNSEVVLAVQKITNSSYEFGNSLNTLFLPNDTGGWSSITPTVELVNAYWDKNGNPFTPPTAAQRASNYNNGAPNAAYYDEFKNRDTRLYASILFPSNPWDNFDSGYVFQWGKGGNNNSKTGYNFRKVVDPASLSNTWDGAQDIQLIRYAEILLTYAEAKNEASGPDATIYAALNDIRDRAGMPAVDPIVYGTKVKLRELIRNERRIELAGEGQRFHDIRRWNIASSVMKTIYDITNGKAQERTWEDKFIKMPYPQSAIDHNPNLKDAQAAKGY
ncbi:Starch-binding associating with outer membrane [Flavobacterium gillisiae]|uniref:Starch-binding associating with outer membrane n=1 Tax=Flavobacterium gillisiae TaxID=150146 RepID=A0A1H4F7N3_9FLAO|nr:RagB/SusD family nutrient uptake outer membrane protein [Flavobacterium gillisiae]SEA92927.1 Starch-binding associating with outer membrane [Flavobacterium gillisiae]